MIYTTCLMCYITFSFDRSRDQRTLLAGSLLGLSIFITLYYHVSRSKSYIEYLGLGWVYGCAVLGPVSCTGPDTSVIAHDSQLPLI